MAKTTLNYKFIASQLSVEEIALQYGYEYVPESTCNSWPVLRGPGGKIVVGTNGFDKDYYFNPHVPADKGNVINFAKNHLSLNYAQMTNFFFERLGDKIFDKNYDAPRIKKEESKNLIKAQTCGTDIKPKKQNDPFDITKHNYRPLQLSDIRMLTYFESKRHLPAGVFFNNLFKENIGVNDINYNGKVISNLSFPLTKVDAKNGSSTIVGLYQTGPKKNKDTGRIESFKYFTKGSERGVGVWRSSLTKEAISSKNIPLIVLESPIDAMSLYVMHKEKLANAVFVSPIGQVSDRQVQEILKINNIINSQIGKDLNDHSNVIVAMDNDEHGLLFNIKVKCGLAQVQEIKNDGPSNINVSPSLNNDFITVSLTYYKNCDEKKLLRISEMLMQGLSINKEEVFSQNDSIKRQFICLKNSNSYLQIDKNLTSVLGIKSAYPKTKDWNEDLTRSMLLHSEEKTMQLQRS